MRDFDDDLEPVIGTQFGAFHGTVVAAVPLPGAEEIIARGRRRRRNGQAALGGLAVLAIVAVATVLFGPLRPDGAPLPPVEPNPSTSVYEPPPGAVRAPPGDTIPPGFLPGDATAGAELKPLCQGAATFSTNTSIVASATVDNSVTLLIYPAGMTASRAFDEYQAEAYRCATDPAQQVERLTFGAEGFYFAGNRPAHRVAAVRYGRSLLFIDNGPTADPVRHAGVLERSLCVFATDCSAREGLPYALPALRVGGEAWAAVLAMSTSPDDPLLGEAVARASTLGYRTSVTSIGCDEFARQAFGLPIESPHRYVSIYFATRADADAFAASVSNEPLAVVKVRTYCLG